MPEVIIPGPEGRLEGRYHHAGVKNAPVVIVLHPNPKHGGTMNNKVVYTLFQSFKEAGFSVLRFNFRGVGKSQGKFADGEGELADAMAALDWISQYNPDALTYWVSGFSFGAWLSLQLLMRRPEIERYVAISPPAGMYDFDFLNPCPRDGLIIQGDQDEIVEEAAVSRLVDEINDQNQGTANYTMIEGADHFFREHLDLLKEEVDIFIAENLAMIKERGVIRPDRRRRQVKKKTVDGE
jgi:uncharacterized protein